MGVPDASDSRLALLTRWVTEDLGFAGSRIEPASADASFRRYFRVTRDSDTYIVMDAPPDKEALAPFVHVAQTLAAIGLNVPVVLARDMQRGLLLLSDLGTRLYLDELADESEADRLYADALRALVKMQTGGGAAARALPPYDRTLLLREMELMPEWFLKRHLGIALTGAERGMLERLFEALLQNALAQPATLVHRDYHSRNLLVSERANPGILDFQDAVCGAVTYDLVSLLKDCYVAWPAERVHDWALQFREQLLGAGFAAAAGEREFMRWFDLMGLQRHIKVLGIFARLYYRDGKPGYLKDLRRVLAYARDAAELYPETLEFAEYLERMRPLTDRIPKPLLEIRGKPLIEHHVERLAQAGFERIVVNLAWLGSMIRDYLGDGSRHGVSITYSDEQPSALETAGGIFRALPYLTPGAFLVVNGDIFTDYPFAQAAVRDDRDAHLILVPNPPQHPGGDFGLEQGLAVTSVPLQYTFSGIAVYRAGFFHNCIDGAFPLKPLLLRAMAAGRCSAELYRGLWEDVGTVERLQSVQERWKTT